MRRGELQIFYDFIVYQLETQYTNGCYFCVARHAYHTDVISKYAKNKSPVACRTKNIITES